MTAYLFARCQAWHRVVLLPLALLVMLFPAGIALAGVTVRIDLSAQSMRVNVDGKPVHSWPVSTARAGYRTPTGTFRPIRLERMWYSIKYDGAPMPHSIFFHGGYAIHGTTEIRNLGRPASHGCIRLPPDNARKLFELVVAHGMSATRIIISN